MNKKMRSVFHRARFITKRRLKGLYWYRKHSTSTVGRNPRDNEATSGLLPTPLLPRPSPHRPLPLPARALSTMRSLNDTDTPVLITCQVGDWSMNVVLFVCLLICCLTSKQHASVSQGRICSDNCTCCHTEIEVADQTLYLTQSQYTDTGPTSPSTDPRAPGTWQGSHWSDNFWVAGMTRPRKNPIASGNRTRDLPLSR